MYFPFYFYRGMIPFLKYTRVAVFLTAGKPSVVLGIA
jgi:hypothetical protein